jgi:hypothetical protein
MDLGEITEAPDRPARGTARRLVDGREVDRAAFVYAPVERWRVRHADGRQIVTNRATFWDRASEDGPWTRHDPLPDATHVHHNAYLVGMLKPARFTPLTQPGTWVERQEQDADGIAWLAVRFTQPESGTFELWWHPDGYLQRFAFSDGTSRHVYEMRAALGVAVTDTEFDPAAPAPSLPDAEWDTLER